MNNDSGFTLVEIIMTLVLLGIIGVAINYGLIHGVKGFLFVKNNSRIAQNSQFALSRITRDFKEISDVSAASDTSITYTTPSGTFTLKKIDEIEKKQIELKRESDSVIGVLIDNLGEYNSDVFLQYEQSDGSVWSVDDDEIADLYYIKVNLILKRDEDGFSAPDQVFNTYVNPRNTGVSNMPIMQ
ncbi:MAG: prepilin-type N-terminal cleavage/methylation domain-containing protein [bacterium]|nr:prepilin-type N-terminal cleavage/methylation domain-containing protein [bacterium]